MIQFAVLQSNRIDKDHWDSLMNAAPDASLYQTYDYLSLCEGDWEAVVAIEEDCYVGALVMPFRIKAGMKYLYQSPFIPYLTILTSKIEIIEEFIQKCTIHLYTYRYVAKFFLRGFNFVQGADYRITNHSGLQIDLQKEYSVIRDGYSNYRKIRLRKTKRRNQTIVKSDDLEMFVRLYEEHTLPKIHSMHKGQGAAMRTLWEKLQQNQQIEIYHAESDGKVVAGFLLGKFGHTIYYLASASTKEGRKLNSTTLLIDQILQAYAQTKYQYFDLGNIGIPGISEFKLSFGATPILFIKFIGIISLGF
jgi:hypothetical protein